MGTRNITRIRKDGELRVCQYGQWDGYPSCAGRHILEFISSHDMDAFASKVDTCSLRKTAEAPGMFFTGAPAKEELREIGDEEYGLHFQDRRNEETYKEMRERVKCALLERYGRKRYAEYIAATRDTGYRILDAIDEYGCLDLFCTDYLLMKECDWQIEAINTIDLDSKTVVLNFHNHYRRYSFDEILEVDVVSEMEKLEQEGYTE